MLRLFETLDRRAFHNPTLRNLTVPCMGLLRFSLFEAVEKSVIYSIRAKSRIYNQHYITSYFTETKKGRPNGQPFYYVFALPMRRLLNVEQVVVLLAFLHKDAATGKDVVGGETAVLADLGLVDRDRVLLEFATDFALGSEHAHFGS